MSYEIPEKTVLVSHRENRAWAVILTAWRKQSGRRGLSAHLLVSQTSELCATVPPQFRKTVEIVDTVHIDPALHERVLEDRMQYGIQSLRKCSRILEERSLNFWESFMARNYTQILKGFEPGESWDIVPWLCSYPRTAEETVKCLHIVRRLTDKYLLGAPTLRDVEDKVTSQILNQRIGSALPRFRSHQ